MAKQEEREPPGLKAIHAGRADRLRGKYSRPSGSTWLIGVAGIIAVMVAYRLISGRQLDSVKDGLLAKQRAVESTVGKEWFPLRDRIEKVTLDAAGEFKGDFVDSEASRWDFRSLPGIYLRLRVADAKDAASMRRAAGESAKDGFVGCLLREPNAAAARGERDAGAFPDQPWNLRQAYSATRVLTPEWVSEVKEAGDALRLRVFEQQYDKAAREEIPMAVDLVKRAQFFLLVLDEDSDAAKAAADGGPVTEESLQLLPHDARVHVVNLRTGAEVLRLRRVGAATFMSAGEHTIADPETKAAIQRQVNNCSLAQQVQAAIAPAVVPPPTPASASDAGRD